MRRGTASDVRFVVGSGQAAIGETSEIAAAPLQSRRLAVYDQKMPLSTRRSSTRFTPRTFVGSKARSPTTRNPSNRTVPSQSPARKLNQINDALGILFMGM